jgi:hypothetical protein
MAEAGASEARSGLRKSVPGWRSTGVFPQWFCLCGTMWNRAYQGSICLRANSTFAGRSAMRRMYHGNQ